MESVDKLLGAINVGTGIALTEVEKEYVKELDERGEKLKMSLTRVIFTIMSTTWLLSILNAWKRP